MSEWIDLKDAPLKVTGHLWAPDRPSEVHHTGFVYEAAPNEFEASSPSMGMVFTKWHPFPDPPIAD